MNFTLTKGDAFLVFGTLVKYIEADNSTEVGKTQARKLVAELVIFLDADK